MHSYWIVLGSSASTSAIAWTAQCQCRRIAQHLADAHVRELQAVGHFAPLLAPESTVEELISFFESVRQTGLTGHATPRNVASWCGRNGVDPVCHPVHRSENPWLVAKGAEPVASIRGTDAENWKALQAVGEHANKRLCDAQAPDARPAPDVVTLGKVTRPSTTDAVEHAPRCGSQDPRVMALIPAIVGFCRLLAGATTARSPS